MTIPFDAFDPESFVPYLPPALVVEHRAIERRYHVELQSLLLGRYAPLREVTDPLELAARVADATVCDQSFGEAYRHRKLMSVTNAIANHHLFWRSLRVSPDTNNGGLRTPLEPLLMQLMRNSGWQTEQLMISAAQRVAAQLEGSGWLWLCYTSSESLGGQLEWRLSSNNEGFARYLHGAGPSDPHPLLAIDLWEHAYCGRLPPATNSRRTYQRVKPLDLEEMALGRSFFESPRTDYVHAMLQFVVDWGVVHHRYHDVIPF